MRTRWEKLGHERSVICVIEQEKPIFAFPSQPDHDVVRVFTYLLPKGDILQVGVDGLSCGGIDEEDIGETVWTALFSLITDKRLESNIPVRLGFHLTFLNKLGGDLGFPTAT